MATVSTFWPFSALPANSAIDRISAFCAGSSFVYSFEGNANSAPAGVHHPALYPFTFINFVVGDYQLYGLTKEKLGSGFDKGSAATYIFDDTFVFLIVIIEKY